MHPGIFLEVSNTQMKLPRDFRKEVTPKLWQLIILVECLAMQAEATAFINRGYREPFKIWKWEILFTNTRGRPGAAPSLCWPTVQGELKICSLIDRHCTGPMALNPSQEEGGPLTGKITRSWGEVERETGAQEGVAMLWKVFFYSNQYFLGSITLQLITQLRGRRRTQIQLCECRGCHPFSERTHDRDHFTQVWELTWKVPSG